MGVIRTDFESDPSKLIAAYQQLYQAHIKMMGQMSAAAQQSKKHHDEAMHFAREQVGALTGMATGLFTVEKAVESVAESYNQWQERIEKAGAAQKEVNELILRGISLSGQAQHTVAIREGLAKFHGLPPAEAARAYEAAHAGAPLETSWQRKVEIAGKAGSAIRGLAVGADVPQFVQRVAQVSTLFPGRSVEDVIDITRVSERMLGKHQDKFFGDKKFAALHKLFNSGAFGSPEEAMGTAIVATDRAPELISGFAQAVEKQTERPHGHALRSAHGRGLLALSKGKTPQERARIIRENPEAASAAGLEGATRFLWVEGANVGRSLTSEHGVLAGEARALAADREGRQLQSAQHEADELARAKRSRGFGEVENRQDTAAKIFETHLESSGLGNGIGGAVSEFMQRRRWGLAILSGYLNQHQTNRDPYYAALKGYGTGSGPDQAQEYLETRNRVEGYRILDDSGRPTLAAGLAGEIASRRGKPLSEAERGVMKTADETGAFDHIKDLKTATQEQTVVLREIARMLNPNIPGGPAVVNSENER